MATVFLAPTFGCGYQAFLPNGLPNSNGFLNTYLAGTTTPSATWTTSAGTINNAVSIPLDVTGKPPNEIWFTGGTAYKVVVADSTNTPIGGQTYDNLSGINDTIGSSGTSGLEWTATNLTPTYISATSFSVPGNATTTFQIGRRVKTTNTGGTIYSSITNSVFGGGITTVTVVNDTGVLDTGLSAVFAALLAALNPSVPAILPYSLAITGITGSAITTSTFSGTTVAGTTISGTAITGSTSVTTPIVEAAAATSLDLTSDAAGLGTGWRVTTSTKLLTNPGNTQFGFAALRTTNQTSGTTFVFDSTGFTGGWNFGTGYATGTGIFTVPTGGAGIYAVDCVATISNSTGGGNSVTVNLVLNGANVIAKNITTTNGQNIDCVFAVFLNLTVGETVAVASTGALSANASLIAGSHFSARLVG